MNSRRHHRFKDFRRGRLGSEFIGCDYEIVRVKRCRIVRPHQFAQTISIDELPVFSAGLFGKSILECC